MSQKAPSDLTESKLTERYQFDQKIGEGGAGEVMCAWDKQLARTVAIKLLKQHGIHDDAMKSAWQEAMRLAAVRHANIVGVYDMGVDRGTPFIVMEYVQGETLEERALKRPLSQEEFVSLARQTMDGLVAAHAAGLVHRDIKPTNIMLAAQPSGAFQVKILDFGIARFLGADARSQTINFDGTITGSIYCISPEQLNQEPVDSRADLYATGCVFYYALTGRYPFYGATNAEIITAHLMHRVLPLESYRPDLPPILCQWVMALFNRAPDDRYQTALEALQALDGILATTPPVYAPPPTAHSGPIHPSYATPTGHFTPGPAVMPPAHPSAPTVGSYLPAQPPRPEKTTPAWLPMLGSAAIAAVLVGGALAWMNARRDNAPDAPTPAPTAAPTLAAAPATPPPPATPAPTPAPEHATPSVAPAEAPKPPAAESRTILRMAGSNTVGAALAPALAEAFLKAQGATDTRRIPGKVAEESTVIASLPNEPRPVVVEIAAHGTRTAFSGLLESTCEIGMASSPAHDEEVAKLAAAGVGDLRSPACEHVVGLDGLAVFVYPGNPVSHLTKAQIADIFAGNITDWAEIGGDPGPIVLHARDDKSGTYDSFKNMVLGKTHKISPNATRYEDSNALSDAVSSDPQAIGFAGLPYVRNAKALAVSDTGENPLMPSPFTVATEDYALSRRLYLYTQARPSNPWVQKFIEFTMSDPGQEVVSRVGFIKQAVETSRPRVPDNAPPDYAATIRDAERLSLNFRFRSGSTALDNKAQRDLKRVADFLSGPAGRGKELILAGFSDATGSADANLRLSRERAEIVAAQLRMRGINPAKVLGLGPVLPLASNETEIGRDKNRRVEVWVR